MPLLHHPMILNMIQHTHKKQLFFFVSRMHTEMQIRDGGENLSCVQDVPEAIMDKVFFEGGATIDTDGGHITFPDIDIFLSIPAGAVPVDRGVYVHFKICTTLYPQLPDGMRYVSPVVACGPHGIKFQRPVILSHPIIEATGGERYLPLVCNQPDSDTDLSFDVADDDTSLIFFTFGNRAYWITDHFTLYSVGVQNVTCVDVSVYYFSNILEEAHDVKLRIYCYLTSNIARKHVRFNHQCLIHFNLGTSVFFDYC